MCKACGDTAVQAVIAAVAEVELEAKSLQVQLLDLESEVLFDFNSLQDELLEERGFAENLRRQLEESELKRSAQSVKSFEADV